jgi:hypothetical protein
MEKEITGYKCDICGHIYSALEADLAKFDLCSCGNRFMNNATWSLILKDKR